MNEYWSGTDDIPGCGDMAAENAYASSYNATIDAVMKNKYMEKERKKMKQNKALMDWAAKRRKEKSKSKGDRYTVEIIFENN